MHDGDAPAERDGGALDEVEVGSRVVGKVAVFSCPVAAALRAAWGSVFPSGA
jgi:hypothetical protein